MHNDDEIRSNYPYCPAIILPWVVYTSEGKPVASFDSETEANFYLKSRGHTSGGRIEKQEEI